MARGHTQCRKIKAVALQNEQKLATWGTYFLADHCRVRLRRRSSSFRRLSDIRAGIHRVACRSAAQSSGPRVENSDAFHKGAQPESRSGGGHSGVRGPAPAPTARDRARTPSRAHGACASPACVCVATPNEIVRFRSGRMGNSSRPRRIPSTIPEGRSYRSRGWSPPPAIRR
jgi:hypothetical protein